MQKIRSVLGPEPTNPGEGPVCWAVDFNGVTHIEEVNANHGTYGITWYHVWAGSIMLAKLNALHILQVQYQPAS